MTEVTQMAVRRTVSARVITSETVNKVTTIGSPKEREVWLKEWRTFLKISIVVLRKGLKRKRCQFCPPPKFGQKLYPPLQETHKPCMFSVLKTYLKNFLSE